MEVSAQLLFLGPNAAEDEKKFNEIAQRDFRLVGSCYENGIKLYVDKHYIVLRFTRTTESKYVFCIVSDISGIFSHNYTNLLKEWENNVGQPIKEECKKYIRIYYTQQWSSNIWPGSNESMYTIPYAKFESHNLHQHLRTVEAIANSLIPVAASCLLGDVKKHDLHDYVVKAKQYELIMQIPTMLNDIAQLREDVNRLKTSLEYEVRNYGLICDDATRRNFLALCKQNLSVTNGSHILVADEKGFKYELVDNFTTLVDNKWLTANPDIPLLIVTEGDLTFSNGFVNQVMTHLVLKAHSDYINRKICVMSKGIINNEYVSVYANCKFISFGASVTDLKLSLLDAYQYLYTRKFTCVEFDLNSFERRIRKIEESLLKTKGETT